MARRRRGGELPRERQARREVRDERGAQGRRRAEARRVEPAEAPSTVPPARAALHIGWQKPTAKIKVTTGEDIDIEPVQIGTQNFMNWQYETYLKICSSTPDPNLTLKWLKQIEVAKSYDDPRLDDPPGFVQIGLKLAVAV